MAKKKANENETVNERAEAGSGERHDKHGKKEKGVRHDKHAPKSAPEVVEPSDENADD